MNCVTQEAQELVESIRAGSVDRVRILLSQGADPNTIDGKGQPVLRVAAAAGQATIAARLLYHGADFRVADPQGRPALSHEVIGLDTLHRVRQHFHRMGGGQNAGGLHDERLGEFADRLSRNGIIRLEGLLDGVSLEDMQRGFARFVRDLNARILRGEGYYERYDQEEHWWPRDRAYVSNNAFSHSGALARLCSRPDLLDLIGSYLGKPPNITRGVAMRYLADEEKAHDMFGWHHDMEDRRLKLLVLLTDVGPNDQYMSYVLGSNRLFHPYEMFLENECSLEYCRVNLGELRIFNTVGRAGDVFLFDSNGAHRGNRRPEGKVRDAYFVEYSGDRSDVWGGDLVAGALEGLEWSGHNPFGAFLEADRKWERTAARHHPTWVENLPDIASWALLDICTGQVDDDAFIVGRN